MAKTGGTRTRSFDRVRLKAKYEGLLPAYEAALQTLQGEVRGLLAAHGLRPTIKYRVKRFGDYFDKLVRTSRQQPAAARTVADVLGLRIICPFLEDIESVAALLAETFDVVELERRGAELSFREFGYNSVHLLVRLDDGLLPEAMPHTRKVCEVQLRTILQDAWAEVEHEVVYKSDLALPNESIRRKLAALNANLTLADLVFQEIRDQQKELRESGRKRRESLVAGLFPSGLSALCPPPATEPDGKGGRVLDVPSPAGTGRIEKTLLRALHAHGSEDLETALGLYDEILRMRVSGLVRSVVYNHRGMAYFALSRHAEALRDFSRAVRFDPGNPRGYTNRALTYRILKDYERAVADYDRALEIDPSCLDALWGRAQTLCDLRLYAEALADCEEALHVRTDFTPARDLSRRIRRRLARRGQPPRGQGPEESGGRS